jgi:hypothetical protein
VSRRLAGAAICAVAATLVSADSASAGGGRYVLRGGSAREQAQVRAALEASSFDWDLVPMQVTITITRGAGSCGVAGQIFLDADLLDAGRLSWGVVQHEYGHQVDFLLLDDRQRSLLRPALGGRSWWQTAALLPHGELTSERFASALAWAFWPSPDNVMRPDSAADEAGSLAPTAFRTLLTGLLATAAAPRRLTANYPGFTS